MSFIEYTKEKWFKPIIDSIGIITWMVVWFGGALWFSTDQVYEILWTLGFLFVSVWLWITYLDYRFWKLETSVNNGGKRITK